MQNFKSKQMLFMFVILPHIYASVQKSVVQDQMRLMMMNVIVRIDEQSKDVQCHPKIFI
jgi:hypothetical protein